MTGTNRVTAQDFYDYAKCPHRVYLNRFGKAPEKLPLSDFLNLLFERALLHEHQVIASLACQVPSGETLEERAASTIKLMEVGAERIYHGVLLQPEYSGIPDLLERVDGPASRFGGYFYKPVDIKSGSGYENEEKGELRQDYGLQLFHYAALVEKVQGAFPPEGVILNKGGERVVYPLGDFRDLYARILPELRALVTGAKTDEPALSAYCLKCQWWGHCEPVLHEGQDVTLLPDVGRSKKAALNSAGIRSIAEIPGFDFSGVKVKGVGAKTIDSLLKSARAFLSGKIEVLNRPALPNPPVKIYLDFEDDPLQELIYLCGILTEPAVNGGDYRGLFGIDEAGEARLWLDLQQFCAGIAHQDYAVFHYSQYERTKIKALETKYGVSEREALELFKSRMIDLHTVTRHSVVVPVSSYSIKQIWAFVGHQYSVEDPGGAQSIVWFEEFQHDPTKAEVLDKLLSYNREDCLALKSVYRWLSQF
ncbi:MAG: TM0106 family RecB-like putative nuclease [Terriglobia bacterium]